jgi:uncharacterized protein YbaA (DUF1428 family)
MSETRVAVCHIIKHWKQFCARLSAAPRNTDVSIQTSKVMSHYVDGFVIPLHKDKIETYRKIAEEAGSIWKEHGALEYYECVGDDLEVKDQVPFPKIIGAKPDETVVFSWIVFESREHRDAVNQKVISDPRLRNIMNEASMPFDCERMAYGGFRSIVEA